MDGERLPSGEYMQKPLVVAPIYLYLKLEDQEL